MTTIITLHMGDITYNDIAYYSDKSNIHIWIFSTIMSTVIISKVIISKVIISKVIISKVIISKVIKVKSL